MNTTYEDAILNMIAPLTSDDKLKILASVKASIVNESIEPSKKSSQFEQDFYDGIKKLFSLVSEQVIYLTMDELQVHVLDGMYQKEYLANYLKTHKMKVGASVRKLMPRCVNEKVVWIKAANRFYTFYRHDFS